MGGLVGEKTLEEKSVSYLFTASSYRAMREEKSMHCPPGLEKLGTAPVHN